MGESVYPLSHGVEIWVLIHEVSYCLLFFGHDFVKYTALENGSSSPSESHPSFNSVVIPLIDGTNHH